MFDPVDPTWRRADLQRIAFAADHHDDAQEVWYNFRTQHVGASDVGAILDKSAFTSPYEVWQRKTSRARPYPETTQMYWGNVLEEVVAREYEKRHPEVEVHSPLYDFANGILKNVHETEAPDRIRIERHPSIASVSHPEAKQIHRLMFRNHNLPLAVASPDRIICKRNTGETYGLEIKTTASWSGWEKGRPGEENSPRVIPYAYYLQVVWSMMVMDLDRWDLAALICGSTYREYTFFRNKSLENEVYNQVRQWWHAHVEGDVPPPMSGHESLNKILLDAYPSPSRNYLTADEDTADLMKQLEKQQEKAAEEAEKSEALKQQIKARIQDNRGVVSDDHRVDWIRYEQSTVKWKDLAHDLAREYTGKSDIDPETLERWSTRSARERFALRKTQN